MRKWIKRLAVILLCFVAVVAVVWAAIYFHGRSKLHAELAHWRDRGVEFQTEYHLADTQANDADERPERARSLLETLPEHLNGALAGPDEADPDKLAEAVDAAAEVLAILHALTAEPEAPWGLQPASGNDTITDLLPRLRSARLMARVMCAEAMTRARAGDMEAAEESLLGALSIGHRVGQYDLLIALLVEISIDALVVQNTEAIFTESGLPSELASRLEAIDFKARLPVVIENEARYGMIVIESARVPTWNHDWAYTLGLYRGLIESAELEDTSLRDLTVPEEFPWWSMLSSIMIPAWDNTIDAMTKVKTMVDLAEAAVELRRYKEKQGEYPDTLSALETLPIDPYNGQPFSYRRDGDGFTLTSSGSDRGGPIDWHWEK